MCHGFQNTDVESVFKDIRLVIGPLSSTIVDCPQYAFQVIHYSYLPCPHIFGPRPRGCPQKGFRRLVTHDHSTPGKYNMDVWDFSECNLVSCIYGVTQSRLV